MFSCELDYSEGVSGWCFYNFRRDGRGPRFLLIPINNCRGGDEGKTYMVAEGAVSSCLFAVTLAERSSCSLAHK